MSKNNVPDHEGIYFVKTDGYNWCNAIACITGSSPFFKINVWKYGSNDNETIFVDFYPSNIEEWGSEIIVNTNKY